MQSILIIITVSIITLYLRKGLKKPPVQVRNDKRVYKASKLIGIIGYCGYGMSILILLSAFISGKIVLGDLLGLSVIMFLGCPLGLFLIAVARNIKVEIDEKQIMSTDRKGITKEMSWNNIKQISYSKLTKRLIISDGEKKITLTTSLVGFFDLVDFMRSKVNPSLFEQAQKDMENNI